MTPAETLTEAKALIAAESRWCQMGFAHDEVGNDVDPCGHTATRWCGAGAVLKVTGQNEWGNADEVAFDYLARVARPDGYVFMDTEEKIIAVADVNDRSGKKDIRPDLAFKAVHKMYDEAIALAEASA